MANTPLRWLHKRDIADWLRETTPFDPSTNRGAGITKNTRWNMDCLLTPEIYLKLTNTTRHQLISSNDMVERYAEAMEAQMAAGAGEFPIPWLIVNWENRRITGHEGRHRAAAAWMLNLPFIPVVLVLRPKAYELEEYVPGRGVVTAAEDTIPLVQSLKEYGKTLVWNQDHDSPRLPPPTLIGLEFVDDTGQPIGHGYRYKESR